MAEVYRSQKIHNAAFTAMVLVMTFGEFSTNLLSPISCPALQQEECELTHFQAIWSFAKVTFS